MKKIYVYSDVKSLENLFDGEEEIDKRNCLEYSLDWFIIILQRNRFYHESSIDKINEIVDEIKSFPLLIPNILIINVVPSRSPLETPIMFSYKPEKECYLFDYAKNSECHLYKYQVFSQQVENDYERIKQEFVKLILGRIERPTNFPLEVERD